MRTAPGARAALLLLAAGLVVGIRLLPLALHGVPAAQAPLFQYEDAGGRPRVYLGDYDSYAWLRAARNLLRTGSACDARDEGGGCRDTYTLAPLGLPMPHPRSLHTAAIAATQRVATALDPTFPLASSAYLVPVIVGALGVLPAFAIAANLAGIAGGFVAALAVGLHPLFLQRSVGSDNDVWNVVLPLYVAWLVIAAVRARRMVARAGLAAAAGAVTGLHAMTWRGWSFGCTVMLAGLGTLTALGSLRALARRRGWRWPWPAPNGTAFVAAIYALTTSVATIVLAGDDWLLQWPRRLLGLAATLVPGAAGSQGLRWPSALADVGELIEPSLSGIAAQSNGYALFFIAWIGIVLLLLPRRDWRPGHFAVLLGATILYRLLLPWDGIERSLLIAALLLPLLAALVVDGRDGGLEPADCAGAVIIATWFVAALAIAHEGIRYVMLLAAPLGLATGVAAGRLFEALGVYLQRRLGAHTALRGLLAVALLAALAAAPLFGGYRVADAYVPPIDRSWAESFTRLRDTAPPDAIINAWWDYGHWAKYFAERRVAADGATLLTHVPNWIARAQLSGTEAEAVGILRMLDCGSDAALYPEGDRGAYGTLLRHGIEARAAYALIERIVPLDRANADRVLRDAGLDADARREVLAASHCDPPPAYLMLTTQQAHLAGWWQLGRWRPGNDGGAPPSHPAPHPGLTTADWVDCELASDGTRRCTITIPQSGAVPATAVTYRDGEPTSLRVHVAEDGEGETALAPDLLLVAANGGVTASGVRGAGGIAVALDADRHRVLVGDRFGIDSLFTRLAFLDGAGATHFRKVDERSGRSGRVTTWAIDW